MPSPYREVEESKPPAPKSGELVYHLRGRVDMNSARASGFNLVAIPTAVAVVLGTAFAVEAGVVGFLASIAGVVLWSKKYPKDIVLLKVESGVLRVLAMGNKEVFRTKLDELDDVVLETKQVERVMDVGPSVVNIGMGPVNPSIASPTETKRIVLEPASGEPFTLTKEFLGHAETTEWFAKIRLFLRNTGWSPLSEREEKDEDEEEEDDDDA